MADKDKISLRINGLPDLERRLKNLVGLPVLVIVPILAKWALKIQSMARRTVAVDQGVTRASILTAFTGRGLTAEVGSDQKAAVWLEEGTRPHFPPPDALIPWVKRHGLPPGTEWAIARKIAQRGTPPRPFLLPAYDENAPQFVLEAKSALGDAIQQNNES